MLIKAGAVVATVAAGFLVLSPFAYASDHDGGSCRQHNSAKDERDGGGGGGLLNVSDVAAQVPVQLCNNSILEGTLGVLARNQSNDDSHGDDDDD